MSAEGMGCYPDLDLRVLLSSGLISQLSSRSVAKVVSMRCSCHSSPSRIKQSNTRFMIFQAHTSHKTTTVQILLPAPLIPHTDMFLPDLEHWTSELAMSISIQEGKRGVCQKCGFETTIFPSRIVHEFSCTGRQVSLGCALWPNIKRTSTLRTWSRQVISIRILT